MNTQPTLIEFIVTNILSSSAPHFATHLQKKGISITTEEIAGLWNVPVECTIPKVITPSPKMAKAIKSNWPKCIGVLGENSRRAGQHCDRTAKYGGYCKTHAKQKNVDVSMEHLPSNDMMNNQSSTSSISSPNNIPHFIPSGNPQQYNLPLPLPDKKFGNTTVTTAFTTPNAFIPPNGQNNGQQTTTFTTPPNIFIPPNGQNNSQQTTTSTPPNFIPPNGQNNSQQLNNIPMPNIPMLNNHNHNSGLVIEKQKTTENIERTNQSGNQNRLSENPTDNSITLMDKVVTNSNIPPIK